MKTQGYLVGSISQIYRHPTMKRHGYLVGFFSEAYRKPRMGTQVTQLAPSPQVIQAPKDEETGLPSWLLLQGIQGAKNGDRVTQLEPKNVDRLTELATSLGYTKRHGCRDRVTQLAPKNGDRVTELATSLRYTKIHGCRDRVTQLVSSPKQTSTQ